MLQRIIDKFLCLHLWKSHAKVQTSWIEDLKEVQTNIHTTEILICEYCGKIKKLEY